MIEGVIELRRQIVEEIKEEFNPMPLTVEHYKLAEMRLQTALGVATQTIAEELEVMNEEMRGARLSEKNKGIQSM